jgi:hypothetical protein
MIRYVPKDIEKDVQSFVDKECKQTGVHIEEKSGRMAIATTNPDEVDKLNKKFAGKGLVL